MGKPKRFLHESSNPLKLDLGCGLKKPVEDGVTWVGVDVRPFPYVDYVINLGKDELPFEDDSVDFIQAIHVFEHLYPEELFHVVSEAWRVVKPQGCLHIEVPRANTPAFFIHPDHKIAFEVDTFGFFQVPSEGHDPHGYLDGKFWHVSARLAPDFPEHIHVDMYPNKPNGRFDYVEVKPYF